MQFGDLGINRKEKRRRHKSTGKDHVEDLKGSSEFLAYVPPSKDKKGYGDLRLYLESLGCRVAYASESPLSPGKKYESIKVTHPDNEIPYAGLKRAHTWAHSHDFLHSFFRPLL